MKFETARIHFLGDVFLLPLPSSLLKLPNNSYMSLVFQAYPLVISIGNSMTCSDIWHKYHA